MARAATRIRESLQSTLYLGDMDAKRDWGYARDYVEAMWLMLQQDEPDDYVVATGIAHSVQDVVELAFGHAGLDWKQHVHLDPALVRPAEVDHLIGDATKARTKLGWAPTVDFEGLVQMMVEADLECLRAGRGAPPRTIKE